MIAIQQSLNCGAAVCELNAGVCVIDAGMEFVRCPTCCVLHIPPENLLHSNVLPDRTEKLSIVMKILLSMRMRWLLKELPQLADKDIWIADVGCGDGQFLEFLGTRGYSKIVGIEPDVERAFNARKRNVPVFASRAEAEAAGMVEEKVDALFAWHVLEHIERSADFIRECADWLSPSGVMIISAPNQASLQTRLFGFYSAYPDYGRHVWYHTSDYLGWIVRNVPGFDAAIMYDRNYEYEIFSWVDSIASALTRRQNFIHKALKKGDGAPTLRLVAAIMAACLLPIGLLLSPLSIRSGRASTLTFILRRIA